MKKHERSSYAMRTTYIASAFMLTLPTSHSGRQAQAPMQILPLTSRLQPSGMHLPGPISQASNNWKLDNRERKHYLGARLLRENKDGERIGNNALIACATKDAKAFMLGTVSWRSVTRGGQLQIGVQYLPGVAQAVIIKKPGHWLISGKIHSGFILARNCCTQNSGSLVIPRDAFQTNRVF